MLLLSLHHIVLCSFPLRLGSFVKYCIRSQQLYFGCMGRQPTGSSSDSAEELIQYTCQVRNERNAIRTHRLRLSEFLDNKRMIVARLSTLYTDRLYLPVDATGNHFC